MRLEPGTVAYWRGLFGQDKFIYILGVHVPTDPEGHDLPPEVLWFTISSQLKWAKSELHRREMVEIPKGTADYLPT